MFEHMSRVSGLEQSESVLNSGVRCMVEWMVGTCTGTLIAVGDGGDIGSQYELDAGSGYDTVR